MASIRNRNNKWQVRIIRKGFKPITKTFLAKGDAEKWARKVESEIDRGTYTDISLAEETTLKEVIQKYSKEVSPSMKSYSTDLFKLNAICRRPISKLSMAALTPKIFADYRDERLKKVSSGTVLRELYYFSAVINHARREWGINIQNPILLVKKPAFPKGRTRILSEDEKVRLLAILEDAKYPRQNIWMKPLVAFALETGMRRGEMLALLWSNVNLQKQIAFIETSKNSESRFVPLSMAALNILKQLSRSTDGRVFPVNDFTVAAAFLRATKRANIPDFHFHDLRHTAITNLASKIPNILELSAISGHKTLSMLKRYTHFNAEDLAKKLG